MVRIPILIGRYELWNVPRKGQSNLQLLEMKLLLAPGGCTEDQIRN
jgi:hypothetical protein